VDGRGLRGQCGDRASQSRHRFALDRFDFRGRRPGRTTRVPAAEELAEQLRTALAEPGPHLIDTVLSGRS
jgi:hypothetical protein